MKPRLLPALLILAAMIAAPVAAHLMRPTQKLADLGPKIDLETMIPKQFGEWRIDDSLVPIQPSPDLQAALSKIYNQTLARTYVNASGERVMLSIAYGTDQSDNFQIHLPEGCYTGQGFAVESKEVAVLATSQGELRVARSVARLGLRVEPITYWIVVDNTVALDLWEMKKTKLPLNLRGQVAEGMLLRVSNIANDIPSSYKLHQRFINDLLEAIDPNQRRRFFGESRLAHH